VSNWAETKRIRGCPGVRSQGGKKGRVEEPKFEPGGSIRDLVVGKGLENSEVPTPKRKEEKGMKGKLRRK